MKLLRIDSSARRNSVSRQLTQRFVETWKKEHPTGEVIERDLATTYLPLITDEWTLAAHSDPAKLTPAQRETLAVSDTLIEELLAADTIVMGAPMYNLTVSAPLKGWIDQVVARGPDRPLGAERYGRRSERKEGCSAHLARRFVSPGHSYRPVRPSGALFAPHPRVHRLDGCHLHPRRESEARGTRGTFALSRHRAAPGRCCAESTHVDAA